MRFCGHEAAKAETGKLFERQAFGNASEGFQGRGKRRRLTVRAKNVKSPAPSGTPAKAAPVAQMDRATDS